MKKVISIPLTVNTHHVIECDQFLTQMNRLSAEKGYTDRHGEIQSLQEIIQPIEHDKNPVSQFKQIHCKSLIYWAERDLITKDETTTPLQKIEKIKKIIDQYNALIKQISEHPSLSNGVLQYFNFDYSKAYYRLQNCHILLHNNAKKHIISALTITDDGSCDIATLKQCLSEDCKSDQNVELQYTPQFLEDQLKTAEIYLKTAQQLINTVKPSMHMQELGVKTRQSQIILSSSFQFIYNNRNEFNRSVLASQKSLIQKQNLQKEFPEEVTNYVIATSYYQMAWSFKCDDQSPNVRAVLSSIFAQKYYIQ